MLDGAGADARESLPETLDVSYDIAMTESQCPWLTGWCDHIQLGRNQLARGLNHSLARQDTPVQSITLIMATCSPFIDTNANTRLQVYRRIL
jgi:hypothetical protein